jgi:predicted Zn-dependent peptidase
MFQKTTLDNGLRVVTAPMPAAKSVAVMVMVAAGSRYETKPTSGIAHFAEHMFFKGTEKRPTAKDISAEAMATPRKTDGKKPLVTVLPFRRFAEGHGRSLVVLIWHPRISGR